MIRLITTTDDCPIHHLNISFIPFNNTFYQINFRFRILLSEFKIKVRGLGINILTSFIFWRLLQTYYQGQLLYIMSDQRIVFKVIMLGGQGVGKSSMLLRYMKGNFSQTYHVTVGVQFATRNIAIDDKKQVKLQIWDTSGQEAFKAIVRTFYKGISGVFLTFAINNKQSLNGLHSWLQEVREHGHEQIVFFLVGTKADLQNQRQVDQETIQEYLREIGAVFYIETSSKYGTGIEELFTKAAHLLYKKYSTNKGFRNLVRPVMASNIEIQQRADSIEDVRQNVKIPSRNRCC